MKELRCDKTIEFDCTCYDYQQWDVSAITNFEGLFQNLTMSSNTTEMETWEVAQVTSMASMFRGTTFPNGAEPGFLEKWNMQINVQENNVLRDTSYMFSESNIVSVFQNEIAPYRNVLYMSNMFAHTPIQSIGRGIETDSVVNFDSMFLDASTFGGSQVSTYGTWCSSAKREILNDLTLSCYHETSSVSLVSFVSLFYITRKSLEQQPSMHT